MRKVNRLALYVSVALASLALAGCDFPDTVSFKIKDGSVSGKAVDVQAASSGTYYSGLVGATITLTNTSDSTKYYTATVGSSGRFSFSDLPVGSYKVTGTQSGWTFVPRTVDITGDATLPDCLAYLTPTGADADQILIITEWQNAAVDVDSHLIIDNSDNFDINSSYPETAASSSAYPHVFWGNKYFTGTDINGSILVSLDRDVTPALIAAGQPAVETLRIISNPCAVTNTVDASDSNGSGWLKFYLHSYKGANNNSQELTGWSDQSIREAKATVHVMKGVEDLGDFALASETAESTLMALKIQVTYDPASSTSTYYIMSTGNFDNQYRSIAK